MRSRCVGPGGGDPPEPPAALRARAVVLRRDTGRSPGRRPGSLGRSRAPRRNPRGYGAESTGRSPGARPGSLGRSRAPRRNPRGYSAGSVSPGATPWNPRCAVLAWGATPWNPRCAPHPAGGARRSTVAHRAEARFARRSELRSAMVRRRPFPLAGPGAFRDTPDTDHKPVDVGLGRVEGGHPADDGRLLIPDVEEPVPLQGLDITPVYLSEHRVGLNREADVHARNIP